MLDNGECEPAKAVVHGVLMATVAVCAAYNMAAWLKRRETHLAINSVLYCAAVSWGALPHRAPPPLVPAVNLSRDANANAGRQPRGRSVGRL